MREGENYSYEIIRDNNGRPNTMNITVDVVRGESAAKRAVENYDSKLTDDERYAGVRHFSQRSTKRTWAKAERRVIAYNPESCRKR